MKRRIYKKWLKNPLNKRLIWKFCKPFPKIPPVAFVEKHAPACVFEQLSKNADMLIQREMDRLCIPKELLRPINIGASGNIVLTRFKKNIKKGKGNEMENQKESV